MRSTRDVARGLWAGLLLCLVPAIAQSACPTHTVQLGESLHVIAQKYLGDQTRAYAIYAENREQLGSDPDIIPPGVALRIPCAAPVAPTGESASDTPAPPAASPSRSTEISFGRPAPGAGSTSGLPQLGGGAETARRQPSEGGDDDVPEVRTPEKVTAPPGPVHVLTGAPYLPYIDPKDPGGGLITELILAAFARTDGGPLEVGFVNDRNAHLDIILPRGGFAFSFPWSLPECEPGEVVADFCARYRFSDSLYEQVTEFFARADSAWADLRTPSELPGARLCRAEGYPSRDLADMGITEGQVTLVALASPQDCLTALDRGEVDIASMDGAQARAMVTRLQFENPLVVLETLTRIERLRAVALAGDPRGESAILRLNAGISALVEDGTWFAIVSGRIHATGG